MSVFISHRHCDSSIAYQIAEELKKYRITPSIIDIKDDIDGILITDIILHELNKCTHLIAVISDDTVGSWWVPFEIGIATQGDKRIVSFDKSYEELPGYLRKWPVINEYYQLKYFVNRFNQDNIFVGRIQENILEKSASLSVKTASEFHNSLKSDLGQR